MWKLDYLPTEDDRLELIELLTQPRARRAFSVKQRTSLIRKLARNEIDQEVMSTAGYFEAGWVYAEGSKGPEVYRT